MEKNSTLFTPASDDVSVRVETKMNDNIGPKAATIQRLCQLARATFSDAALVGMPVIVLN